MCDFMRRPQSLSIMTYIVKQRKKNQFTIYETRTQLSSLLKRVEKGEELIIANGSRPVARIVPFSRPSSLRKPGCCKGMFVMKDDFDAPLEDEFM